MSAALAPPFVVAALLLCVAGTLKLGAPGPAAGALRTLGLPARAWMVRALAAGEVALGIACAVQPARATAAVLAGTYATFAGVAAVLARERASCGCFGDRDLPATSSHAIASAALAAVSAAAAIAGPRGLGWVLGRPAVTVVVLAAGIAGALYATVLVYTKLPAAWAAWSGE
ncbi:MAG TPA: MauE/DoxX family redox-associated membrane protein [Solirubrobacteraceae bacterium]|nr:MauE/DoxX family redox-associated membrane protein [Solirubrobacteraceae bacterium]